MSLAEIISLALKASIATMIIGAGLTAVPANLPYLIRRRRAGIAPPAKPVTA
jgi:hypothetical protein